MRERRDKWGNEKEQSTRPVWAPQDDDTADVRDHPHGPHEGRGDNPTRIVSGGQGSADRPTEFMTGTGGEDARTVPVPRRSRDEPTRAPPERGTRPGDTILVGRDRGPTGPDATRPVDDPMTDPPVGWLVVVAGPGRGSVATLGLGRNSIGRTSENRVTLGEHDKKISGVNHCEIIYDAHNRQFFIQDKDSKNLTYVDDRAVLAPAVLDPLAHIRVGDTTLRFVPLCGEHFVWELES